MDNKKAADVLNKLVQINNDRIEGYETALKETKDAELKSLFSRFAQTSFKNRQELAAEVSNLGEKPTESTKPSGKFFRQWMDVKAALTNNDRKSILASCEFGEDAAVHKYDDVMKNDLDEVSADHKTLIAKQYALVKGEHDIVRQLRDSAK